VHELKSSQLIDAPDVHVPAWHTSTSVHASLSSQTVPSVTTILLQPLDESQASAVQELLSSQFSAAPDVHAPA
jgi:hypothetical protein